MKTFFSMGALLAASAAIAGCHGGESATPSVVQTAQARVVLSSQREIPVNVRSTGTVHARESAAVSAQAMGRILQIPVREGDNVRAGQTLVVLDAAALRASAEQAQAGVRAAQGEQQAAQTDARLAATTLERYRQLEAQKSVSPQEMDEVTRRSEAAAARLEAARAQTEAMRAQESGARTMLGYTRLVAPFAGVVTARMADPGTMASPGIPLLQVDRAGTLQLQVAVDESAIGAVRKGTKVQVAIDGVGPEALTGTVAEIVPAADPSSHSFAVKIDLPSSSRLRAGLYGSAEFASGTRQAILVPRSSVVYRGSLACAYALDGQGIAQLRHLTVGDTQGDFVEVLAGVSAGERLVDAPSDRELSGKRIEVQP
jgi:RND family efflux transporter MFP subunit